MSKNRHNRQHNRNELDANPYDEIEYQPKPQKPKYAPLGKLAELAKQPKNTVVCRWCKTPGTMGGVGHEECSQVEEWSRNRRSENET